VRIVDYPDNVDFEEIETLTITIKAIPFEGTYVPAFVVISPEEDYPVGLDEVHCLMDGIEIAQKKLDSIINYLLQNKVFKEEDEPDVDGESDT
jgi:hypothetical protein